MRKDLVIYLSLVLVISVLFLSSCSPKTTSEDVVPDDRVTTFSVVCDTQRNVGMFTYAYHKNVGGRTGFGYAIRMSEAEYEIECSRYEK